MDFVQTFSTRARSTLETSQKRKVTSRGSIKIDRQLIGEAFFIFFLKFFVKNDIVDSCIFWLPTDNILGWHEAIIFHIDRMAWKTTLFHAKLSKRS